MSNKNHPGDSKIEESSQDIEPVHPYQKLLDNPWLLWLLGFIVPTISYTLWGLYDLYTIGKATLP